MNILPLLTYGNVMLAWDIYNYYVIVNTTYNGVYYSGKFIKVSYSLFKNLIPNSSKKKKIYEEINVRDDYILIKEKDTKFISVDNEKDWNIIVINK